MTTSPSLPPPSRWDIFCNVIDNFGDIGVCWRLARQLASEQGFAVRLWVDDLASFKRICPEIDPAKTEQCAAGIEIRLWAKDFDAVIPGDVVIEAFACRLPERFEAAMAHRYPKPIWINFDYLTAEEWVEECHALPSPHPTLPLTKYFFFPGFTESTGGLLREHGLPEQRSVFEASPVEQERFLAEIGLPPANENTLQISLFSYENPAIRDLLAAWAEGSRTVRCLVPLTRNQKVIESFIGEPLQIGSSVRKGRLELCPIPFIPQPDYDKLLWSCDINFVRGEDSFVRAQWAAKPMLWQIYPQDDNAHIAKLEAFLNRYCDGLPEEETGVMRQFFVAWNNAPGASTITPHFWETFANMLPTLRRHAHTWEKSLSKQQDLCGRLVQFCRSKL